MLTALNSVTPTECQTSGKIVSLPPLENATKVFYRYSDMVYRLALTRCKSRSDAEDVMQDVFLRYVRSEPSFSSSEHQRAWLIRTTLNCINTTMTSAWKRHTAELTEDIPDMQKNESSVYAAVARLPKKLRTVIHLFYYEGYKVMEIADMMDANPSTVKSWLRRARISLERDLKGDFFDV